MTVRLALDRLAHEAGSVPMLLVVPETPAFRCRAREAAAGAIVLEVGCSYGEATASLLAAGAASVLGLDSSIECLRSARGSERLAPHLSTGRLSLRLLDALRYPAQLQAAAQSVRPSVVLLDIGGDRDLPSVFRTLCALTDATSSRPPRLFLVKSRELYAAAAAAAAAGVGTWSTLRERLAKHVSPPPASGERVAERAREGLRAAGGGGGGG
ncbi:hypothetical protein EMIHUDRAFT_460569, partial [Emiliania huxleyi CCMP1516]